MVAEQHAEPHDPVDLLAAVWLALDAAAPRDDLPWLPGPPTAPRRVLRAAVLIAGIPAFLLGTALDRLVGRTPLPSARTLQRLPTGRPPGLNLAPLRRRT